MTRNYRVRKQSTRQPKVRHANRWPGLSPLKKRLMAFKRTDTLIDSALLDRHWDKPQTFRLIPDPEPEVQPVDHHLTFRNKENVQ